MTKKEGFKISDALPRRKFLINAGLFTTGAVLSACGANVPLNEEPLKNANAQNGEVPKWPFPFKKLDPEVARRKAYDGYYTNGGCMGGAIVGTLGYIQEEVGAPYTSIPLEMFRYGAGGVVGWGTLCGSLNGASAFLNLITDDYGKLVQELVGWYTQFPFPSDKHDDYCKVPGQITTVANSPLCHVSVTLWSSAAGAKANDIERKDRCAKLTGDVAAKAIELLNAHIEDNFVGTYKPSEDHAACMDCHSDNKEQTTMVGNNIGKMDCFDCHDDHTK